MTDMSVTMTTSGGNVYVAFHASVKIAKNNRDGEFRLVADATEQYRVLHHCHDSKETYSVPLTYLVTGLSAASHTFKIQWRVTNSDTTLQQSATTWSGAARNLTVIDLGS